MFKETKNNYNSFFVGKFYGFTVYMVCANSIVNPFVYVIQYHEFQKRTKEVFCEKRKQFTGVTTVSTTTTDVPIDVK